VEVEEHRGMVETPTHLLVADPTPITLLAVLVDLVEVAMATLLEVAEALVALVEMVSLALAFAVVAVAEQVVKEITVVKEEHKEHRTLLDLAVLV
jgi:hypothetical protein